MATPTEQKIDKLPGGLTAQGVTSTSGGRQQYSGIGGTYFENPQNVGTPQYHNTYSFIPSGSVDPSSTNPNNPITSGTTVRSDVTAIGNEIKNYTNTTDLTSKSEAATKLLQDRMDALDKRRGEEIASIKASYEEAAKAQGERQGKDYAGQSTNLITAGGGFLGTTGSQTGVLNNLRQTHENEKTALISKRDAAIREAQNAYDDKQFTLAQAKIKEAKDLENELYTRQKDQANQELAIAREERAKQEYERGYTDERLKGYSLMSDEEFAKIPADKISEIDKYYFPGYTVQARKVAQEAAKGKSVEDSIDFKNKLQTLINKTPQGQKITLPDGTTYVGMKKPISLGGTKAGMISLQLATDLGAPALAGKDESDVMMSLSLEKPPTWYKELYQSTNPQGYAQVKDKPNLLAVDWANFVNQPDIQAYKNSAVVTNRINKASDSILGGINPNDLASIISESLDE